MRTFAFVCLLLGFVGVATPRRHRVAQTDRLPVTLYYEALCPYCMEFVTTQLSPSMVRLDRLPYTDLKLIPFGNAQSDAAGNVTCQHGLQECELNAWHACILEHHEIAESLKLIACMMRGKKNRLDKCADRYRIDVADVKNCRQTRQVNDILQKYGEETAKVSFLGVPAIALDNIYDADLSANLTDHFDSFFCAAYKEKFQKKLDKCE
ncbi:GILT-like protein 2 [Drosophila rhopaloa]|uniref:GILT-like protein F37H8.5 n=1 Tax=Drosophila rhopaloa TaxID=1041015 RepID=A0A6P4EZW3_DRORH|nr:GILT-like protein 2 [Drosophila rhopaloa]